MFYWGSLLRLTSTCTFPARLINTFYGKSWGSPRALSCETMTRSIARGCTMGAWCKASHVYSLIFKHRGVWPMRKTTQAGSFNAFRETIQWPSKKSLEKLTRSFKRSNNALKSLKESRPSICFGKPLSTRQDFPGIFVHLLWWKRCICAKLGSSFGRKIGNGSVSSQKY